MAKDPYKWGIETREHREVAAKVLGRPLPKGVEVHHVNSVGTDNQPTNLVICPSKSYHILIHLRQRAFDACGHADYRKCEYCKEWDDPKNMMVQDRGRHGTRHRHRGCHALAMQLSKLRRMVA